MFQLTAGEMARLAALYGVTTKRLNERVKRHLDRFPADFAFRLTPVEVVALIAVQASIQVVRAFVRLRQMLESNAEFARKLDALEQRYDSQFRVVFQAIRELMAPPLRKRG